MRIYWDTETTDYWDFKKPPTDPEQPMLAQIAAILEDESGRTVAAMSALLRQDMWPCDDDIQRRRPLVRITPRVTEVHGITNEQCARYGQDPQLVLNQFRLMMERAEEHVGHNIEFDMGVLRNFCRVMHVPEVVLPKKYCTMMSPEARATFGERWQKLGNSYYHFSGRPLNGAHDALVDVYGCRTVYRGLTRDRAESQGGNS